jgi:hypothetical protein
MCLGVSHRFGNFTEPIATKCYTHYIPRNSESVYKVSSSIPVGQVAYVHEFRFGRRESFNIYF